ncbi:LysR substrate-binding domain-containing protein [Xanthomonas bonasiae]|jgi:DNA-binding transcriptional LysR family regulator|uniref:LysR substrate-binding domain-containing protein n=1 Tax=Xanthomonas bonasiae TaxID=2810351 RepID=UPI0019809FA6|nr:LysR substrate-binding domain-containing protein [Xanthomonas bonasiae]MBN6111047.1 LysR family transcriptional regulator [Xanthomonas bonasiae]
MHLDFIDLRLFVAVAEAGSITAGADRAALSLAAASARIRALEQQAGAALFARGRRGVSLTAAGAALLRHARQLLRQAEAMRAELGEHAGANQATVRLLANTAALYEWLPELLAEFLVAHPRIDLALREQGSSAAADAVREERADLAVIADHADLAGLHAQAFRQDRLVLVAAATHPLARAPQLRLAQLWQAEFLGLADDSALQRHLRTQAARAGGQLRIRAHVHGIEPLCRMLARGAGVAILPQAALARVSVREHLVAVPLQEPWAARQLSIVWRPAPAPAPAVRQVLDWLCAHADGAAATGAG